MISVTLKGLEGVADRLRRTPSTIGLETAFSEAGLRMEVILRARTPAGFNRRLGASATHESAENGFVVGYEVGVETAGDNSLDSAARPRTQGRSVLARRRWVSVDELGSVLSETVDESQDEVLSVIERSVASGLS